MALTRDDVAAVGRRVAAHEDAALDRLVRPSTEERLASIRRKEAAASRGRRLAFRARRWGVALVACAAASALFFALPRREAPLSYRLDGATGAVGQWVAADLSRVALDFSDGSRVDLAPGTRARVTKVEARGAGVLLEHGSLHVHVVPRGDNHWVVVGGPFEVLVVGTEFDVAWNAQAEEIVVSMVSGHVRVVGPCVEPPGRALAAPETARLSCRARAPEPTSPVVAPSTEPSGPPEPVAPAPTPAPVAPAPKAPSAAWRAHLSAGELNEALAEVERSGVEGVIERAHDTELVDLGSAARLAHEPDLAVRFYEAARRRFPGSAAAAASAYHLGRMLFDGRGAWAEAARWFEIYLAESPRGSLAPEALGRSMECADKLGDRARARELASRYLAAYPNGAHVALATTLAGEAH